VGTVIPALAYRVQDYNTGIRVQFPTEAEIFLFPTISRQALESTQLPIQWVLGLFPWGGGNEADHHLYPVLGLRHAIQ
jgi:hypothetical protein